MLFTLLPTMTENEVNNLIYLFMKYGFKIDKPKNSDIYAIMINVGDDQSIDNIIDQTIDFVETHHGSQGDDRTSLKKYLDYLYREFKDFEPEIRNGLGSDTNAPEFVKN